MYLKSLEVQGFKSFPDKTLIRFGDDITAIVGPNGSGKSNISDAILWVMGEMSSKTLRGNKMEDVIFGGTQKRAAVGFAEATLTFDNADRALPYDADEVMVTRRYYRSGDGEYYINRHSARLKDVLELFMDTGLGREGYSNIGQGRIDEILALKSTDRREIFEEAAGISRYRHRKEETERKLAATEDNLLRIGDKVSELEIQLEPLRTQAEKARSYLQLKDQLRGVEVAVWLDSLDKLSAAVRKAQEDYASASFVLQQAHDDLSGLYRRADELGERLHDQDGELETVRQKVNMLDATHQQLEGRLAVLRGSIDNNNSNISRIQEELQGAADRSCGIVQQISQSRQRIEEVDALLEEKNQSLSALQQQLTAMAASAEGLTKQYLQLRSRETDLLADIAGADADTRGLETSREQTAQRMQQLEQDCSAGQQRLTEARQGREACTRKLEQSKADASSAENVINGITLRSAARQQRRQELEGQTRALGGKLDTVGAKLRVFRAMERDYENYQRSVRLVMQEAQRGRLQNIHGPVSRLIRTEDRFTAAIEIALGGALQQIVVGAESDGKAAISYLKRIGGGRATFLPLTTIRGKTLQEYGLETCPGFVGIASQVVSCQNQYREIVDNLLGRTVLAEDIDSAIAMSRQYRSRFKIVTLDGQVMNPGGSMTGGSFNKESGILSRANELQKLAAQEKALLAEKQTVDDQLRQLQEQSEEVEAQLAKAREDLRMAQDSALQLQGEQKQFDIMLDAIRQALDTTAREQDTLRQRESGEGQRQAAQQAKLQVYARELEQVRLSLAQLEGSQTEASDQTARLTEQMTTLRTEAAALEAEKATALAHVDNLTELRSSMEGDRQQKQNLMASIEAENQRLEEQISAVLDDQSDNGKHTDTQKRKLQQILTTRANTEAAKTKAEREAQEKNKDILNMERACALLEQKKATASLEERQITDKLWDNYGLTPGTAAEHREKIDSAAAGNRLIAELKKKLSALGTPNLGAIEEFARINERYTYLTAQRDDVLTSKKELERIIRELTKEMTTIFVTEFRKINGYFGKTFEEMFGGGKGELILEDLEQPLTCGIEIRVQPPGKQVKTISLLSGGEKAFVAIALYFAILQVRPTPFCMLDEIDAALDDRNVERFASYLRQFSKKTQFIVITHRRGTMELSDVLYGVTMQEQGISKLLRLDLNQMQQYLGIEE